MRFATALVLPIQDGEQPEPVWQKTNERRHKIEKVCTLGGVWSQNWIFPGITDVDKSRPTQRPSSGRLTLPTGITSSTTTTPRPVATNGNDTSANGLTVSSLGVVFKVNDCSCLSTPEYNPVCGNDGRTYVNQRVMDCAIRCGHNNESNVLNMRGNTYYILFSIPIILLTIQVGDTIDCFKCVSLNGNNKACDDPFHNNYTTGILESPCMGGRKGRNGVFPATACIKLIGVYETGERITVRGCALDSGTLTTDTEIIRMSHCGGFIFEERYVHGCLQSCDDADACNSSVRPNVIPLVAVITGFIALIT